MNADMLRFYGVSIYDATDYMDAGEFWDLTYQLCRYPGAVQQVLRQLAEEQENEPMEPPEALTEFGDLISYSKA